MKSQSDMREGLTSENIRKSFKEFDLEKARSGIYQDTPENQRLNRVGQKYGHKTEKESKPPGGDRKVLPDFDTQKRHSKDGIYSKHRLKVHKKIKDKVIGNGAINEKPTVTLIMGGSASGKGSASKWFRNEGDDTEKVVLDVDKIKEQLPEYKDFSAAKAASNVHEESSDLGKDVRADIIGLKMDFVSDATMGDKDKALKYIKELQAAGYAINLIGVTTDIDESKRREQKRYEGSGRKVPTEVLEDSHIGGVDTYEAIKGLVDTYALYDNNNGQYDKPVLVDSHEDGVVNDKMYQSFLNKKNYEIEPRKKKK